MRYFKPTCRGLLPLLFVLAADAALADEADAFNFFAGASVARDSNLFRLAPGTDTRSVLGTDQRSDTINTYYVGGTLDKLIGRQRLRADATINAQRFQQFSRLDNDGGNLQGTLLWTLTDLVTGTVGKSRERSLSSYRDLRSPVRNVQTTDNGFATLDLWAQPNWHGEASVRHWERNNSADVNQASNSLTDARAVGLRYTPRSGNYLALRETWTTGHYPNRQVVADLGPLNGLQVDNGYDQTDLALEGGWQPTGASRLTGVLARTERTHRNVPERNFSGMTGNAAWDWNLTGKASLSARIRREIGAQDDLLSSYAVTDAVTLAPTWAPTAKTTLKLQLEHQRRDFRGDPLAVLSSLPKRHDRIDTLSFNVGYQPMRSLLLTFSAVREKRDSNTEGMPYDDTTVSVGAQFSF